MPIRFALFTVTAAAFALSACSSTAPAIQARQAQVSPPGTRAVAVVRVRSPWYAPRFYIRGKFHDALGEYESIATLDAKYFSINDRGAFGGIYLWRSRADAEAHFDAAWHARVREKRGVDGDVLIMDAPLVVDGRALPSGTPEGARSIAAPVWATLVRWPLAEGAAPGAIADVLASRAATNDALIRAFIVAEPRAVGIVSLWSTRAAADEAGGEHPCSALGAAFASGPGDSDIFEVPLLIDGTLRTASP